MIKKSKMSCFLKINKFLINLIASLIDVLMFSGVCLQNLTKLVTTLLLHIPVCVSSL